MKIVLKYWYIIVVLLVIGGGWWWKRPRPERYREFSVTREPLRLTLAASGVVTAERKADLMFQSGGRLAWVGVKEGQRVKKWQGIASLDRRALEKNLQKELNDYLKVRWDFQGSREAQNVTTDNLDAYTLSPAARRVLEKSQFDLNIAVLDVEVQAVAKEFASIIAPFDGLVSSTPSPVGTNVQATSVIATLVDPDSLFFQVQVDELDIGDVTVGQTAILTLDAYPDEPIESRVFEIGFSPVELSGGGTGYVVKVELPRQTENLKYKLGMNGDATITVKEIPNALTVPLEAVSAVGDRFSALVRDSKGKIREVPITTGSESEGKVEVLDGLHERETVVVREKT